MPEPDEIKKKLIDLRKRIEKTRESIEAVRDGAKRKPARKPVAKSKK